MVRRALVAGFAGALLFCGAAQAATHELSTSNRLQDRREVSAGTRAYSVGFEDGRFYANGWHITGEMGGVWTPPLKMLDGLWFGVDGSWVGPATRFTSGWGYTRYALPAMDGLSLQRTDFVPDGRRAALFGLTLTNPARRARHTTVQVDAHSELMGSWPWGTDPNRGRPSAQDDLPDHASFDGKALVFRDQGALPGGPPHDWAALVASTKRPRSGVTGDNFRGPQSRDHVCSDGEPPSQCDDGPYGHGKGGELTYRVTVPPHGSRTVWVAVAGSDQGLGAARSELSKALRHPARELAAKIASRDRVAKWSQVDLPGDRLLQQAIGWSKQNLADLTQTARNLQIRWTNQGKDEFPPPLGTVREIHFFGAGYPDYPWLFATDGEYTTFAALALGQFRTAEDHLRALRDVSEILNNGSGVVAHETVQNGAVYFGHDSRHTNPDGSTSYDFNTDETVKFPSAVALVWRWTGDNRFRDDMYSFSKRALQYVATHLDEDNDGWPEGSGNVEVNGMGQEKLDNAVYFIRGLYDLADMARSKGDTATAQWADGLARRQQQKFEADWWDQAAQQYADSLVNPGNAQLFQKFWIGEVPMEAELTTGTTAMPGIAPYDHGVTALEQRETSCYSGDRPLNRGLFHTGCGGGPDGKGSAQIFSLGNAIAAVGEGDYGRLGTGTNPDDATEQRRYTDANAETMISEPETGGTPDEQPGALPEILPSPAFNKNIDNCWTCRSMFMQAWGNYGTAWPVIHQQLGVRPFLGEGRLEIVPQVPDDQPSVQGSNIRLGKGAADVLASHAGTRYTTTESVNRVGERQLVIGHTLPRGTRPAQVLLDGRPVHDYDVRETNRGEEVTVTLTGRQRDGRHTLTVVAA